VNVHLKGHTIVVTRPKHQAEGLCSLIEQQGWNAIRFPTLEIVTIENKAISQQLKAINKYQWLIFVSTNAVNFAVAENNGKIDCFKSVPIAAVGKATEKALKAVGLAVELLPEASFNTEGLLASNEMNNVKGRSCLIIRGKGGRETLANSLRERGAKVDYLEVYLRKRPVSKSLDLTYMLQQGKLDAITITSGESLLNLLAMIDEGLHDKLQAVPLIVISHRIKGLAEQNKFKQIAVTKNPGDTAIIEALTMSLNNNKWGRQWQKK
jgi:uroporphyrinogen-III synthase